MGTWARNMSGQHGAVGQITAVLDLGGALGEIGAGISETYSIYRRAISAIGELGSAPDVVKQVLKGQQGLSVLSDAQRRSAAAYYRSVAGRTGGKFAEQASKYNIARAEFLEGTRSELSPTLPSFIKNGK